MRSVTKEVDMSRATAESFKSLEHHSVARVDVLDGVVELGIPESEGWRLVISAALDHRARPMLVARWEPGLRRPHRRTALRRMIALHPRRPMHRHAARSLMRRVAPKALRDEKPTQRD